MSMGPPASMRGTGPREPPRVRRAARSRPGAKGEGRQRRGGAAVVSDPDVDVEEVGDTSTPEPAAAPTAARGGACFELIAGPCSSVPFLPLPSFAL
eukprot:4684465-Pyramimonas_sp.AAC.1